MQERIREYNEIELADRQNLPNLFVAIKQAKEGDIELIKKFFYSQKEIERIPYDGKMQAYEVIKIHFWDKPLDIFLGHMKKRYTKAISVGEQNGYSGRKITYKVNVSNFEESEIDEIFYTYFMELVLKIDLDKFIKESEAKTLNALRRYIRIGFQNAIKKANNEKIGLERVRVDGKLYYVKNKQEEVFFEDIYIGKDEEGENLSFLDIVGSNNLYGNGVNLNDIAFTPKKFIEENLDDVLTKKQLDKWNLLVEYVNRNGIESILDKYTGKIIKAKVQRIIYPDKTYKNIERVDSLVKIMNQRMENALDKAEMKYMSLAEEQARENPNKENKSGEVVTFTGGLTEDEVEMYFNRHLETIYNAHVDGRLSWDKGSKTMLPSLECMLELPFEVYDKWKSGSKKTKMEIIREYYNPDKFKMKAGKKVIKKSIVVDDVEEKNDRYITPEQLKEVRRNKKQKGDY